MSIAAAEKPGGKRKELEFAVVYGWAGGHKMLWPSKKAAAFCPNFLWQNPLWTGECCDIMIVTDDL